MQHGVQQRATSPIGTKGFAGSFMLLKLSRRTADVWDVTLPFLSREGVNYLCTVPFSRV